MDPRLVAHRPALVYDPQEAYPAASAAMITDHPGSQHETGEARSWAKVEHMESDDGVHPVIYVAPFSHGNCSAGGAPVRLRDRQPRRSGTAHMPAPGGAVAEFIRASAYNTVRQRSDPVEARVGGSE